MYARNMPDPAFPTAQAPRTQGFLNQPDPGDEEALFIQGFSDLAYKAMAKSQPTLVGSVVTFRILEKDVQNGEAVGAFIIKQGTEILFVPVVLVSNAVKPLDLFYCRSRDRYYPLTPDWLREVMNSGNTQMGSAVQVPKSLVTDVDIRNLVVPPSVGRYSYAEDEAWLPFAKLQRELPTVKEAALIHAFRTFPEDYKVSVRGALQRHPKVAKLLVEQYGVQQLRDALAPPPKVAADPRETPMKHDVFLATASTPIQELHRELEPSEVANAYGTARSRGFFIKDRRKEHKELVALTEESLKLIVPEEPGLYRVYMTDGQSRVALIIPNPDTIHRDPGDEDKTRFGAYSRNRQNRERDDWKKYLILFPDGKCACVSHVLCSVVPATYDDVIEFVEKRAKPAPSSQELGSLLTLTRLTVRATQPETATNVSNSDKRVTFNLGYCHGVTKVPGVLGGPMKPPRQDAIFIGEDTVWWPCQQSQHVEGDFLSSPAQIWMLIERGLMKAGAEKLPVKVATEGEFLIGTERTPLKGVHAVVKLATVSGLSVQDAAAALQAYAGRSPARFWVKKADGPPPGADPNGGDPNSGGAAPPGGDPSMMGGAPPAPPPPGFDLVIAEKRQLLQQQMAALQQQATLIDEIEARAMGVAQGGPMSAPQGMMAMMGAPPPSVMGGPALAPVGPTPGAPTGAPTGAPPAPALGAPAAPPMTGAPGAAPAPMAAPGPSPAAMPGAQQPGMDPTMGQGAPPPVMTQSPSAESLAGQISPQFMNDAALLGDPQVFDAAAVATFAKPKALREILQNYAPSLDTAVDKLGRSLLLLYTQTRDIRERIGDDAHRDLEQRVRDVFRSLGDVLLLLQEHGDQISPNGLRPS